MGTTPDEHSRSSENPYSVGSPASRDWEHRRQVEADRAAIRAEMQRREDAQARLDADRREAERRERKEREASKHRDQEVKSRAAGAQPPVDQCGSTRTKSGASRPERSAVRDCVVFLCALVLGLGGLWVGWWMGVQGWWLVGCFLVPMLIAEQAADAAIRFVKTVVVPIVFGGMVIVGVGYVAMQLLK